METEMKIEKPSDVSITIELTEHDMNATLNEFAQKLRDTADIIENIDKARPAKKEDIMCDGMILDFGRAMDPLSALVRMKTQHGTREGVGGLYGGVLTTKYEDGTKTSSVEIHSDAYALITTWPKGLTLKALAELSIMRFWAEYRRRTKRTKHP